MSWRTRVDYCPKVQITGAPVVWLGVILWLGIPHLPLVGDLWRSSRLGIISVHSCMDTLLLARLWTLISASSTSLLSPAPFCIPVLFTCSINYLLFLPQLFSQTLAQCSLKGQNSCHRKFSIQTSYSFLKNRKKWTLMHWEWASRGTTPETTEIWTHIWAVITFPPFLLCKYF